MNRSKSLYLAAITAVLLICAVQFLSRWLSDSRLAATLQPSGLAQLETGSLASALNLRDDEVQAVDASLYGYYQRFGDLTHFLFASIP